MKKLLRSYLSLLGFLCLLKAITIAVLGALAPKGNVTVIHEEVEIEFVEEEAAMNEYEYETLVLRASR